MPRIVHQTLVANVASTVVLDGDYDDVEILNRSATDDIYFRVDGVAATVGGADNYIVRAGQFLQVAVPGVAGATSVSLISAAAAPYSVTGVVR